MEKTIELNDLLDKIRKGVSKLEFEAIKDIKIRQGKHRSDVNVRDYFEILGNTLIKTENGYKLNPHRAHIGVHVIKRNKPGGLQPYMIDPERHRRIADRLFKIVRERDYA